MVFSYYYNLTGKQQAIYRKSDRIESVDLHGAAPCHDSVAALQQALVREDHESVRRCAQGLIRGLTVCLKIQAVDVRVLSVRPSNARSELHGLYESTDGTSRAVITVWMRTVRHKKVVAFRTFLRTLLHEFCHHLDYELYGLADSYHTEGFFKRESSLQKQLLAAMESGHTSS